MRAATRICISLILLRHPVPTVASQILQVCRVTGRDAVEVATSGKIERLHLFALDTTKTVHSQKPVKFSGKETPEFIRQLAEVERIRLPPETALGARIHFTRPLCYVRPFDHRFLSAGSNGQRSGRRLHHSRPHRAAEATFFRTRLNPLSRHHSRDRDA